MDADPLKHLFTPLKLGVVAQRPCRDLNAAWEDEKVVVILRLPERRKPPQSAVLAPAVKKVEGQRRQGTEDRVHVPDTAHIFYLAVLVLLALPHRHD